MLLRLELLLSGKRVARHGWGLGGSRAPGIRRGQRFGTLSQFYELLTLLCPAGHGIERWRRGPLKGIKKQGADVLRSVCNFLDAAKVGLYA